MLSKLIHSGKKKPFQLIILVSFLVRGGFSLVSHHLYYPDEIFQTLEPAFAHVAGFGIQAWEYEAGIRPLFVPLLLSLPLKLFLSISRGNPQLYTLFMKWFLSTWSITIPLAIYQIVKKSYAHTPQAERYALLSGLLAAVWFELVYIAPRALYESLALNLVASAYLVYTWAAAHKKNSLTTELTYALSGSLLALAGATRPQLLIVFPLWLPWFLHQNTWQRNRFVFGGLLTVLAMGGYEYAQTGMFMASLLRYIELQLTTPLSSVFGVEPWLYYLKALLATSGVVLIPALATLTKRASWLWWGALVVLVGSHSLIPHKELRFMAPAVPIMIVLFGQSLEFWQQKLKRFSRQLPEIITGSALCTSLLSLAYVFPWLKAYYPTPFLSRDPLLRIANSIYRDSSVCGIYDESHIWPISLSYYLINRPVPLYTHDYPPPNREVISHQLTQVGDTIAVSAKQPARCSIDPTYTTKRTFAEIQSLLTGHHSSSIE